MPLAHPLDIHPTDNYTETAVAVSFAFARPDETVDDFMIRRNSRGEWGQSLEGRHKAELVFTKESVTKLLRTLGQNPL